MKTMSFFRTFIIVASVCLLSGQCDSTVDPLDETAPVITVLLPNENATFYTEGGVESPTSLVLNATATDDANIKIAYVRVYDSNDVEVHYHVELAATQGIPSITEVYSSFSTTIPGNYTIEFGFRDVNDNLATVTRNATCILSEEGEGEN